MVFSVYNNFYRVSFSFNRYRVFIFLDLLRHQVASEEPVIFTKIPMTGLRQFLEFGCAPFYIIRRKINKNKIKKNRYFRF